MYKTINSLLYKKISTSDVRKQWWVDENLKSDALSGLSWGSAIGNDISTLEIEDVKMKFIKYTNVKFGMKSGIGSSNNDNDWCIMRAEEMILIKAEALAQQNDEGNAAKELKVLMDERDASWNKSSVTVDDVWLQRRIELWGEGFSLFDVLRLKKPIKRIGTNFPAGSTFADIAAESPLLIYTIPECETAVNKAITPADNNEAAIPPTPVQN